MAAMEKRVKLLVVAASLACFFFGGILFGWVAINQALISSDIYGWLCTKAEGDGCDAQITALTNVFNVASAVLMMVALPAGFIVDLTSPRLLSGIAGFFVITGITCIAFAKPVGASFDMLMLGACSMAVGGMAIVYTCNGQITFLGGEEHASTVQAAVGCSFAASSAIGPFIRTFVDAGASLEVVMLCLAALAVPVFALLIMAWGMNHEALMEVRRQQKEMVEAEQAQMSEDATEVLKMPLRKQLCTMEFICVTIYVIILVVRNNLYIGCLDLWDAQIANCATPGADDACNNAVTTVSKINGWVIALGFLSGPVITWTVDRFGVFNCIHISTVTSILYSLLQLVPSVYFQIVPCVIASIFLAMFYTYGPAYCAAIFGPLTFGKTSGIAFFCAALFNFTLTPMINWAVSINSLTPLFLMWCAALVPVLPIMYLAQRKQPQQARDCQNLMAVS